MTKKNTLGVRIDRSGKFSSMTLLRAMSREYSDTSRSSGRLRGRGDRLGRPKAAASSRPHRLRRRRRPGHRQGPDRARDHNLQGLGKVLASAGTLGTIRRPQGSAVNRSILQSSTEDPTSDHESRATGGIYQRLPRQTPQLEKPASSSTRSSSTPTATGSARSAGSGSSVVQPGHPRGPDEPWTLEDYVNAIRYILNLRRGKAMWTTSTTWAIDGSGRIDELASDELRKGFLKLRRTVQERMSLKDAEDMTRAR